MFGRRVRASPFGAGPPYKKRRTAASTEKELAILKRKVNALKPEVKCCAVTGNMTNVSSAVGRVEYISQIAQGVTKSTRLGDQIRLTRLQLRIQATDSQSAASGNFCCRILLVKDKAATGVLPVLNGAANAVMTNTTTLAMPNPSTLDRFTILKDVTYNGNQIVNGTISGEYYFDMKFNTPMDYLDTGSTISSAGSNSLFLIVVTDYTAATSDWYYAANFYFTDV